MACLERQAALDDCQRLGIADAGEAGQGRIEAGEERSRLLHETGVELGPGATSDAVAQDGRLHLQTQPEHRPPVPPRLRQWLVPSETGDLHGPHHAAWVAEINLRGTGRRDATQLRHERGQALGREVASIPARTPASHGSSSTARPRATARR